MREFLFLIEFRKGIKTKKKIFGDIDLKELSIEILEERIDELEKQVKELTERQSALIKAVGCLCMIAYQDLKDK